ncbi:EamA family transporter [Actinomadura namibiensis]|uniref:Drug/metabolite transporter (DMT)-like permease n=1 Tax=Actinomadura namibiensis TaxID=182080 RepID=A0A7W3QJ15_ACTNM|nr:DMT family transporter [Actinomadura namibiensis]MBA8948478.1 drug/metabolite transporter (DMT)-like permease [Actinomadura namibiensis]
MTSSTSPRGMTGAAVAMTGVGSLTAVSAVLADYPVFGGQAVRYTVAAAILFLVARFVGPRRRVRPTARDWLLLTALAATGLAAFNVFIVAATADTSPATIGTVIATVPVALALVGPLLERRRPAPRVVAAALVVTAGAALANGLGGGTLRGLLLALGALAGEVCFSLLAVPLLPRLGPVRVSAYSAALAVPMLLAVGLAVDGRGLLRAPTGAEFAALFYLSVIITVGAFLLWYDALGRLGADRAGLFAGLIPVSAVATTVVLGLASPTPADLAGAALVAAGVVVGIRPPKRRARRPAPNQAPAARQGRGTPLPTAHASTSGG